MKKYLAIQIPIAMKQKHFPMTMIQRLFALIFALGGMCVISSCDDDDYDGTMRDYPPACIEIMIEDEDAANLLDFDLEQNLMDQDFMMEFNGRKYYLDWDYWLAALYVRNPEPPAGRDIPPVWNGLYLDKSRVWDGRVWKHVGNQFLLMIGEWEIHSNFTHEMSLYLPGEEKPHAIKIDHSYQSLGDHEFSTQSTAWLDGEMVYSGGGNPRIHIRYTGQIPESTQPEQ